MTNGRTLALITPGRNRDAYKTVKTSFPSMVETFSFMFRSLGATPTPKSIPAWLVPTFLFKTYNGYTSLGRVGTTNSTVLDPVAVVIFQYLTLQFCILLPTTCILQINLPLLAPKNRPVISVSRPGPPEWFVINHRVRHGEGVGCNERLWWLVLGLDHYLKRSWVGTRRERDLAHCANDGIVSPTSLGDLQLCLSVWRREEPCLS